VKHLEEIRVRGKGGGVRVNTRVKKEKLFFYLFLSYFFVKPNWLGLCYVSYFDSNFFYLHFFIKRKWVTPRLYFCFGFTFINCTQNIFFIFENNFYLPE